MFVPQLHYKHAAPPSGLSPSLPPSQIDDMLATSRQFRVKVSHITRVLHMCVLGSAFVNLDRVAPLRATFSGVN